MNADIKAIKERCDKATQGPWIWDIRKNDKHVMLRSTVGLRNIVMDFIRWGTQSATPRFIVDGIMKVAALFAKSIPGCEHHTGFDDYIDHPDADFIAHSRTDVENMVADIESLQAQLAEVTQTRDDYATAARAISLWLKEFCDNSLTYDQMIADAARKAANALSESRERERAAVEDMKAMALAMRESEELTEGCCFACAHEAQNIPGDVILAYGECPGHNSDNCFEWRGPAGEGENANG